MKYRLSLTLVFVLFAATAHAKTFRNAYLSFELPNGWNCSLEQTEWVCRSENNKQSKEAIIILTAKEVGPTDSYAQYDAHLNTPITLNLKTGGTSQSKIVYKAKRVKINDQEWVDGLHLGSEVPNYFTRYLATIKGRIAVLVTFSAHKQFYTNYSQDFFKAVMSLRVIETKDLISRPDLGPIRPGSESLGATIGNAMPADMANPDDASKSHGANKMMLLGVALILAALGVYIFLKKKQRK